jgi:acetylglutamate kinase
MTEFLKSMVPFNAKFGNKLILLKLGGNALVDDSVLSNFVNAVAQLQTMNINLVITHGGGPQISAALNAAEIESKFIGGYRYTSKEATAVVKQVLCGEIQNQIVNALSAIGISTLGFCGDKIFKAKKKSIQVDGKAIDIGFVGEVTDLNILEIEDELHKGTIIVISAIGEDDDGNLLNLNADSGASALSWALGVDELILLTDVAGVYGNWPDQSSLLAELNLKDAKEILKIVDSGMIPKIEAAIEAIENSVPIVRILDGRSADALLASQINEFSVGTVIRK